MILLYRILTKLIYPFLFILVFVRIFFKKEDPKRYKEKILVSHFDTKRDKNKKLIWFHAASIGELKSIIPIIQRLNTELLNFEFLVTTNTLSSSKIFKLEFDKYDNVTHRFFPFDVDFIIDKFLKLWKPSFIFLVDSEIWPNLILKSKKYEIPLAIINARLTTKSFKRWMIFPKTAYKIFSLFDLCLASNSETKVFLEKLKVKNVYYNGNIKFISELNNNISKNQNEEILLNNQFWVAASTHRGEEELCLKTHVLLKEKNKNILTIIAPRHIERSKNIEMLCKKYKLSVQILNVNEIINPKNEIIILNSFGILTSYFKYAKSVFIGKSTIKRLINDGGQNPLEAAKLRCKIYHGPYVYNFKEIYEILNKSKISLEIKDHMELSNYLKKDLELNGAKNVKISNTIDELSKKILIKTIKDIKNFISNETI